MIYYFVAFILLLIISRLFSYKRKICITGKHVLISGGSSGIGLHCAEEALRLGAKVSILARDEKKLLIAKEKIKLSLGEDRHNDIQVLSVDVASSRKCLFEAVSSAEENFGPIFMLINCAGFSKPARFEDVSEEDVEKMMRVNYLGSFYLTQAAVESMKRADEGGAVVLVSSQGGLVGIYGYTAYASSKSALVKLGEALKSEIKPYGISVTVHCPPDTDTPGFAEENRSKPLETAIISETSSLLTPGEVAECLISDSLRGKFLSSPGVVGFMLTTLCAGAAPADGLYSLVSEIFFSPLFRIIVVLLQWNNGRIIQREFTKRTEEARKSN